MAVAQSWKFSVSQLLLMIWWRDCLGLLHLHWRGRPYCLQRPGRKTRKTHGFVNFRKWHHRFSVNRSQPTLLIVSFHLMCIALKCMGFLEEVQKSRFLHNGISFHRITICTSQCCSACLCFYFLGKMSRSPREIFLKVTEMKMNLRHLRKIKYCRFWRL